MDKPIFIVTAESGEYEGLSTHVIGACSTEQNAIDMAVDHKLADCLECHTYSISATRLDKNTFLIRKFNILESWDATVTVEAIIRREKRQAQPTSATTVVNVETLDEHIQRTPCVSEHTEALSTKDQSDV